MYDHQPDFPSVAIAALPDNDQADQEPVVLSANCVCGEAAGWEATVYSGSSSGWRQTPAHLKLVLAEGGQIVRGDQRGTVPDVPAVRFGDTVTYRGRAGMVIQDTGHDPRNKHLAVVAWDDAESSPQSVQKSLLVITGHDPDANHVVWNPRDRERHGKRRKDIPDE